jgi:uncharacterized repeat protein (TIGR04138 family)
MRCDKCQQNEATIFLTQVVNGHTTKVSLCSECGTPLGIGCSPANLSGLLHRCNAGSGPASVDPFSRIAEQDACYTKEAFWFVRDGLHRAVAAQSGSSRHVTAAKLLQALRSLALERFGESTRQQLHSWGVNRCEDFGEIVFTLIEHGVFGKRPGDKKEDFSQGYDFAEAFPGDTPAGSS